MNRRLLMLAVGVAVGYVLGTRDGRARYDAMKARVTALWEDPRVAKARRDVEAYARQQAPVIRERAEAAAKAAPGVVADVARDVAANARDAADKAGTVAKDVAGKATATAKDVADRASATAKDVADRVTDAASDVRDQAARVAADLRERGEAAVDTAVTAAGEARDRALAELDDEDDEGTAKKA